MRKARAATWPYRRSVLGGHLQGAPLGLKSRVAVHPEWGRPRGTKPERAFLQAPPSMLHSDVGLDESSPRAAASRLRPGKLNYTRRRSALIPTWALCSGMESEPLYCNRFCNAASKARVVLFCRGG